MTRAILAGMLAMISLWATPRPAEAETAEALLNKGLESYAMADFARALKSFQAAEAAAEEPGLKAKIKLYTGAALWEQGKQPLAREAFGAAVELAPALAPAAGDLKPAILEQFNRVRAGMVVLLTVEADSDAGEVRVGGEAVGALPVRRRPMPAGKYKIELHREGKALLVKGVELSPSQDPAAGIATRTVRFTTRPKVQKVAPPPGPSTTRLALAYGTLGLGVASAVGAGVLYGVGISNGSESHEAYEAATDPAVILERRAEVESAQKLVIGGHVLAGVAAVSLGLGLYQLLTLEPKEQPARSATRVTPVALPGGGGILLRGDF